MGDFNCPNIDWHNMIIINDYVQSVLLEFIAENNMFQFVYNPTRFNNILDIILSNKTFSVQKVTILPNSGSSDHAMITFSAVIQCLEVYIMDNGNLVSLYLNFVCYNDC